MLPQLSIGPAEVTERISFVSPGSAFQLKSWTPNETKAQEQRSSSSLSDYDQLVSYRYQKIEETFTIVITGACPDDVADRLNELRSTIKAARDFWVDKFNNEPIYLQVRNADETAEPRYALIDGGSVPTDPPPFEAPFYSSEPAAQDITVILRRGPWMNLPPQTTHRVHLSAVETYDGRNLGNVNTSGVRQEVDYQYVANKHNVANLTHIYTESGAAYSANLMDAVLPYDLFPAIGSPNDRVYFGIETPGAADSGPFCSLVFDIGTAMANFFSVTWEYWSGAAWVSLTAAVTFQDNTNADGAMTGISFDTTGVNSIHWNQPSDWAPTAVNGVTAYWVRATHGAAGVGPVIPTQQYRDVYSITWAYAEVQDDGIYGNLPAMLRCIAEGMSDQASPLSTDNLRAHEVWVGLRDMGRGENFVAYLNAADEQNPTGLSAFVVSGSAAFANTMQSATGRMVSYTVAAPPIEERVYYYHLGSDIYPEYYGSYQCFLRAERPAGNAEDVRIRVGSKIRNETAEQFTDWVQFETIGSEQLLNMGRLVIPNGPLVEDDYARGHINIYADINCGIGTDIYFYDLVLIPTDEWIGHFSTKDLSIPGDNWIGYLRSLDIDSIMNPKVPVRALLRWYYAVGGIQIIEEAYRADINASYPFLTPGNRQRLWFLANKTKSSTDQRSEPAFAALVKAYSMLIYNTMRGTG